MYQITVLDFNYTPKDGDTAVAAKTPVSRYAMRTKDRRKLANALNIIFIELPKAAGLEAQVDKNSPIENWAIFLKDADNPQKQELIQKLTQKEAGLMQAQKSLSNISANRDLWLAQYRQEVKERDWRSGLAVVEKRGIAKGIAQGIAQGERKKALEAALIMLKGGKLSVSDIALYTGLSEAEIGKL